MGNNYTNQLKKRQPEAGDMNWDNEIIENELIDDVVAGALLGQGRVLTGCAVTDGGGLTASVASGSVVVAGATKSISSTSVSLVAGGANDDTGAQNWVYVDSAGAVQSSTTPPTGSYVPLAMVDTDSSAVLRVADLRPFAASGKEIIEQLPGVLTHIRAIKTATQSIPASSATDITWDSTTEDTKGEMTTGTGSKFTASSQGHYLITASIGFDSGFWDNGGAAVIYLRKNGATIAFGQTSFPSQLSVLHVDLQITKIIKLSPGDEVTFRVYVEDTHSQTIITDDDYTSLEINQIA